MVLPTTFPPYVQVPEEDEGGNEDVAEAAAAAFGRYFTEKIVACPGVDIDKGWTLVVVRAILTINHGIKMLHPDLRVGFMKKPARYHAIVRFSCTECGVARMAVRVKVRDRMLLL